MPTYMVSVPAKSLTDAQKADIAKAISERHHEATGAPVFFAQVIVAERTNAISYLGGEATNDSIWVRGDIRAGRSEEARQKLMLDIMHDVSRIASVSNDRIWVYICNLAPTDMVEYGHVLPKPGAEHEWFESLPKSLQDYLVALGTTRETFKL